MYNHPHYNRSEKQIKEKIRTICNCGGDVAAVIVLRVLLTRNREAEPAESVRIIWQESLRKA